MYEVRHYVTADGVDAYGEWFRALRDRTAKLAVAKRIARIESGNLGDHQFCRDGVWELRIHLGAGNRVYYAHAGKEIILLLAGGDKHAQQADIDRACRNWQDWQRR